MKKFLIATVTILFFTAGCNNNPPPQNGEAISFYRVPLICGADESIGCGSRIKPLFIETGKEKDIKESWTNRRGTVIAIVWNGNENEKLIQSIFAKHSIEGKLIFDSTEVKGVSADFRKEGRWLRGMDVDQLSIQEAGTIAASAAKFAKEKGLITEEEASLIKADIEEYFKKELVKVRTYDELKSSKTDAQWMQGIYDIFLKHIGKERADKAKDFYYEYQKAMRKAKDACSDGEVKEQCCNKKPAETFTSTTAEQV